MALGHKEVTMSRSIILTLALSLHGALYATTCAVAAFGGLHVPPCERAVCSDIAKLKARAAAGHAAAQYQLACRFMSGKGVAKDTALAAAWARKSAEQGWGDAQYLMGLFHDAGDGVRKDHVAAVAWYRKAAGQKVTGAMNSLGVSLQRGRGVRKNLRVALGWFRKAAELGDHHAQVNLGAALFNGTGTAKAPVLAYAWTLLGCEKLEFGKKNLRIMAKTLRPSEIKRARKLASRLRKQIAYRTKPR